MLIDSPNRETAERLDLHQRRVSKIAEAIRVTPHGAKPHISKGGEHHVVPLPGDQRFRSPKVDVSSLVDLIEIDVDARTATAEPGLTFEALVAATLRFGLLPMLVPELRGITVGGAIAGCSVESMSYRYGGFHDSCTAYEIVGGDGAVRVLRPDDDTASLFEMIHGSYGTLAVLTAATFHLIPAAPTVEVEYLQFGDLDSFERTMRDAIAGEPVGERRQPVEFIDGLAHGPNQVVLVVGRFGQGPTPPVDRWVVPYYQRTAHAGHEIFNTADYLFRYDADCHWLARSVPPLEWSWVRDKFGQHFLGSTNLIHRFNQLSGVIGRVNRRPDVVCDVFLPAGRFGEFFEWYANNIDDWPLWIVPYRPPAPYPWLADEMVERMGDPSLFIDAAVYGARNNDATLDLSVLLEEAVYAFGGIKTLIGRNHYSQDRFWSIYDRDAHFGAKRQLDPSGRFPDLYTKFGQI